ncbi:MAG: ATP-binding protein [Pseudomonadota bacterium]
MNEPSLFFEEEEIIRISERLLSHENPTEIPWPSNYAALLGGFKKLLSQAKRLVNVGDLMQKDLNDKNERLWIARERETHMRAQLIRAQKMEAVATLAGGISHDFNNLLTVIIGYTEMILLEQQQDDPICRDLDVILESARKGADVVQRLLAFSKKADLTFRLLDLNGVVNDVVKFVESTLPKRIRIQTITAKDPTVINGDVAELEQAILNLCVNAAEAMPDGGNLTVETDNVEINEHYCSRHVGVLPGAYVRLRVTDTGKGMTKETADRLFDPFFTTKERDARKGTGLGISAARGIVEQHGGWITCESAPGMGTSFEIHIPAVETPQPHVKAKPGPAPDPEAKKILLVDNEELLRELGKRVLERAGYNVIAAADGREAMLIYTDERCNIALVVLDPDLPDMPGRQLIEYLIRLDPSVKMVIAGGPDVGGLGTDWSAPVGSGRVNKPYESRRLLGVVRSVLDAV